MTETFDIGGVKGEVTPGNIYVIMPPPHIAQFGPKFGEWMRNLRDALNKAGLDWLKLDTSVDMVKGQLKVGYRGNHELYERVCRAIGAE